jgi:competence protein ComEA
MKLARQAFDRTIVVIVAAAATLPSPATSGRHAPPPAPAAFLSSSPSHGFVQLSGAVRHPGIFPVSANTLTSDVINMAVPLRPLARLRLGDAGQAPAVSGTHIHLAIDAGGTGHLSRTPMPAVTRMSLLIPLDINSMTVADFEALPGIGPAMARRMVEYRQKNGGHMTVEDLPSVEGIGEKRYEQLRPLFLTRLNHSVKPN